MFDTITTGQHGVHAVVRVFRGDRVACEPLSSGDVSSAHYTARAMDMAAERRRRAPVTQHVHVGAKCNTPAVTYDPPPPPEEVPAHAPPPQEDEDYDPLEAAIRAVKALPPDDMEDFLGWLKQYLNTEETRV